jgi:tetratricopeptide (TPR) repeat protein
MPLFYGLYLFETVLLVLGSIFFVVLLIGFVYQLTHRQNYGTLLAFFVVSIAMIGYPSIKSIQVKDGLITLEKDTQRVQANPTDAAARASLEKAVGNLSDRPISKAPDLTTIAQAQFVLGKDGEAANSVQKALQRNPRLEEAKVLQQKIVRINDMHMLAQRVEANPADSGARAQLQSTVNELSGAKLASPKALTELAKGQAALGDHQKALETANTAVAINPASPEAVRVREAIKSNAATAVH